MKISGNLTCPSDKSVSHRAIILSSIAEGRSVIKNLLLSDDCINTLNCFSKLGVNFDLKENTLTVYGNGLNSLQKPDKPLYVGNSGTTIRLISGILSGQNFNSTISGDASIIKRPMKRIIEPLSFMGAKISHNNFYAPLSFSSSTLNYIDYKMPLPSAQVKSCLLLAGLYNNGDTLIRENIKSRNHTEIMIKKYGADIKIEDKKIHLKTGSKLYNMEYEIPSDVSSAAYFITCSLIIKNSVLTLKQVNMNPTRNGIIKIYQKMGANIEIENENEYDFIEPCADINVYSSTLNSIIIEPDTVSEIIDEIPIICIACMFADGLSIIKEINELRVKESDRANSIVQLINAFGGDASIDNENIIIRGKDIEYYKHKNRNISSVEFDCKNDHRIAMCYEILSLILSLNTKQNLSKCIDVSYPNFYNDIKSILK